MDKNLTKDEIVEILLSHPSHSGWKGVECANCLPYIHTTANISFDDETWECPKCGFTNMFRYVEPQSIFPSPTYGVSGIAIMDAWEDIGANVGNYLTEIDSLDILVEIEEGVEHEKVS